MWSQLSTIHNPRASFSERVRRKWEQKYQSGGQRTLFYPQVPLSLSFEAVPIQDFTAGEGSRPGSQCQGAGTLSGCPPGGTRGGRGTAVGEHGEEKAQSSRAGQPQIEKGSHDAVLGPLDVSRNWFSDDKGLPVSCRWRLGREQAREKRELCVPPLHGGHRDGTLLFVLPQPHADSLGLAGK